MRNGNTYNRSLPPAIPVVLDLRDCYTGSFPEFVPFCLHLYYFSSFKAFKTLPQA